MTKTILSADTFVAYADGSSLGNPGKAGWAYLVDRPGAERQTAFGSEPRATSNQMEVTAATRCVQNLALNDVGTIHCDSQYVVKGINEWRKGWEKRGWRTAANKPVLNVDLWKTLFDEIDSRPGVRFAWVKGHADSEQNNTVDVLANSAARSQIANTSLGVPSQPEPTDSPTARAAAQAILDVAQRLIELPPEAEPAVARVLVHCGGHLDAVPGFLLNRNPAFGMSWLEMIEREQYEHVIGTLEAIAFGVYL